MKTGTDPRRLVLELLLGKGEYPTRLFGDAARRAGMSGRDRAFARQLLGGVLRRRRTLDTLWRPFCKRSRLDPPVVAVLRMAVFQRFFLDQVPGYAAIGATLESCKPALGKATGFANAVLRAVDGAVEAESESGAPDAHSLETGRAASRSGEGGTRWVRFTHPLFPDPAVDPRGYWGRALSLPDTLVGRWFAQLGEEAALRRMRALLGVPPLTLRVNPLRSSVEAVRAALVEAGHDVKPGPLPQALLLPGATGDVTRLPGYREGWWGIQDLSSQAAVAMAEPRPGEWLLDLCAAPGGKSFAAYEQAGGGLEVLACDLDHARLAALERERDRLGHRLRSQVVGPPAAEVEEREWDLVVLDVPCSNTGVLGRRPEARWRFREESLREVLTQQSAIRAAVLRLLAPQTRILWTTCSLEPEENLLAAQDLARRTKRTIARSRLFEPSELQSGGFAALLVPES